MYNDPCIYGQSGSSQGSGVHTAPECTSLRQQRGEGGEGGGGGGGEC